MTPDTTTERTEKERAEWNTRYAEKGFVWSVEPNRFLVKEIAGLTPGRALDLAAGEARNAIWLAEQGWTALAVDISDVGLDKGKKLAEARHVADKLGFETSDLRTYQPDRQGFDLVVMFYVHMLKPDLWPIITKASQAVAPGGTFLLVAHDATNLTKGYGGPQNPDVLYTAEEVVGALDKDLTVEKAGPVDRPVETDAGTRIAIDCLVRAKRA